MRTRKPQLRQWCGRGLGQRRVGAAVAVVPALGGELASLDGEGAHPAEAEVLGDLADLRLVVGVERVVAEGVRRDQPRVLVADREQVAGRQVAGLDPLAVGHPGRGHDRLVAGDQHDLVDGDRLVPRGAGDGDRPAPADVPPAGAGEQVGDHPLPLVGRTEVLADVGGVDVLEQRGAGDVGGRDQRGVGSASRRGGGAEGAHGRKCD